MHPQPSKPMRYLIALLVAVAACDGHDASSSPDADDLATSSVGPSSAGAHPIVTADAALEAVRRDGARHVLDSLASSDVIALDHWYGGIASGDSLWLEVARVALPASDGETVSSLTDAVANGALLRAPRLVLRLARDPGVGRGYSLCRPRLLEASRTELMRHREAARQALRAVTDPELRAVRDACLAAIAND